MALTYKKVIAYSAIVDDKPGALLEILAGFADAEINLRVLAGWPEAQGSATILCVPEKEEKLTDWIARHKIRFSKSEHLLLTGEDKVGALVDVTSALAHAQISIKTVHALSVGTQFAALLTFDGIGPEKIVELLDKEL